MQARCELTQTNAKPFLTLLEHLNARRYNALASVAGERLREGAPSRSSAKRRSATNIQQHSELLELFGADCPRQGVEVLRGLPFEARRLGFWPFLVLARASALARRLSAI